MELNEFIEKTFEEAKSVGLITEDGREEYTKDANTDYGKMMMGVFLEVLNEEVSQIEVEHVEMMEGNGEE